MNDKPEFTAFEFKGNMECTSWLKECQQFNDWSPYQGYDITFPGRYSTRPTEETFPEIMSFFKYNPQYIRPEIMKLEPKAAIPPHAHIPISHYYNKEYLYNMALNYPEGCRFGFIEGGYVPYKPGDWYKLFINYDHCVINDSDEDRYHLVWKDSNAN